MKIIAVATAVAMLLAPTASLAQKGGQQRPDFTLSPNYGSVSLDAGFTPDPWTKSILAGGSVPASAARSGCAGNVSAAPDLQLHYEAGSLDLTISATSSDDTTLLINTPAGQWYCDDDSGDGSNPQVTLADPGSGRYDIWVGTYGETMADATLAISELGSAASTTSADCSATYGCVNLNSGFTPDPYVVQLTAGGDLDASEYVDGCVGYIADNADFTLIYSAGSLDLTFMAESSSRDTTLVIQAPSGDFYCDDDSAGNLDPKLHFSNPASGVYHVWIGTYDTETASATLKITEID